MLITKERGVALVLALAVIALLVSLVVDFSYTMMVDLTLAANLRDEQKAFYVARSGVELARHLLQEDTNEYDGLDEDWALLPEHPGFLSEDDEGRFKVTIEDEAGKFPINKLVSGEQGQQKVVEERRDQLKRLFEVLELDPELVYSIIDWLDSDNEAQTIGVGAEDAYYQGLPSPYPCKNGPLDSLDELLLVKGMTKEILYGTDEKKGLIHFLTLYSNTDIAGNVKVNINTASAEVIYSLSPDIEQNQAQAIVDHLKEKPLTGKEPTEWDNVIRFLIGGSTTTSDYLKGQCVIKSSYFSLHVEGRVRDIKKVIYTVLQRDKDKVIKPVFWRIE